MSRANCVDVFPLAGKILHQRGRDFPVRPNGYRHGDFRVSPDNNVYIVAGTNKVIVCNIRLVVIGKRRISLTAAKRKDSKYDGKTEPAIS